MTKNKMRTQRNTERYWHGFIIPSRKDTTHPRKLKKLFVAWLKDNAQRFEHVPVPLDSVKKKFCFEGIIPNITLIMSYDTLEATLFFDERSPCKHCSPWDLYDIAYIGG